jgi:hypothetical protein
MKGFARVHSFGQIGYTVNHERQKSLTATDFFPETYTSFLMHQLNDPTVLVTKLSPSFFTDVTRFGH